jgi:pyruvate kinase
MINICSTTKLVSEEEKFIKVLGSGYSHLRINFSHIRDDEADYILKISKDNYPDIKIIQDLQGPKIRLGKIDEAFSVDKYNLFILYKEGEVINNKKRLPLVPICFENYDLLKDTRRFVISNRKSVVNISVLDVEDYDWGRAFICMSDYECVFRTEKGLNAIGLDRTKTSLSNKDKADVLWGLKNKVDIVILSFVSTAEQIKELKSYIASNSDYTPQIWAKIECQDGIKNAESIIKECDGFMVGRGDMSREIKVSDIPRIQTKLINICKENDKECIIATHLFDNYRDRINLSDATAIYYLKESGATGFMMSDEVTFNRNPMKISKDFYNLIKGDD